MRLSLPIHVLALFIVGQFLFGCAPSTVKQLTKSPDTKQLSADMILELAKGNTLFLHGHKVDSYFYFDDSGYTFAKDIYKNKDTGMWDVSGQDELCFKMNDWWLGKLRCFPVYKKGAKYYLFNSSDVLEFTAELFAGDSKHLYKDLSKSKKSFLMAQEEKATQETSTTHATANEAGSGSKTIPTTEPSAEELKSTVKWMAKDCPGCNLAEANLAGAELIGAKLQGANLSGANLSKANLRRADLKEANLKNANLSLTNLPGADLRNSDLSGADLTGANLIKADMTGAVIDGAVFTDALLEGVEGLKK